MGGDDPRSEEIIPSSSLSTVSATVSLVCCCLGLSTSSSSSNSSSSSSSSSSSLLTKESLTTESSASASRLLNASKLSERRDLERDLDRDRDWDRDLDLSALELPDLVFMALRKWTWGDVCPSLAILLEDRERDLVLRCGDKLSSASRGCFRGLGRAVEEVFATKGAWEALLVGLEYRGGGEEVSVVRTRPSSESLISIRSICLKPLSSLWGLWGFGITMVECLVTRTSSGDEA